MTPFRCIACVAILALVAHRGQGQIGAPALSMAEYDIRDLVDKSRDRDATAVALRVAQALAAGSDEPAIQVRNGKQLVVRATAQGHRHVQEVLAALRRLTDVAVIAQAQLYEVDEAFHTRLRKIKHVPWEELERKFLDGQPPADDLFKRLAKEKPAQTGDEAKANDGATIALLSRYDVVTALPAPWSARRGGKTKQHFLEGVAFSATAEASPDRRSVRLLLTERSSHIEDRQKIKIEPDAIDAEAVFVKEATTTRLLEIPDGGSMLVAVEYRPAALAAKDRWWVLSITARLWIEEEERQLKRDPAR